ncbi:MAG: beta-ketoacyl-ACP synthase II [Bdellovibrionales bacterium]|nr:beta-ketoacyl-ACP synthase II [Bdellovibrionales bacterium]
MANRRVVVTGVGLACPVGNSAPEAWRNLTAGVSGIDTISEFDWEENFPVRIAAEVRGFEPEKVIPAKELRRYDRYAQLAVFAAHEAWEDSGLATAGHSAPRMGCILGVGIGGLRSLEEEHVKALEGGPRKVSPFLIPKLISNLGPGHIAIKYGLQGVNYTVTSACTSGTHAVGEAFRMIRDGLQDVVVTGGAEAAITRLSVAGFARMQALSTRNDEPKRASRPFDRDRDGFVMGEGAAILVLEEMEAAKKRGANIYAEVTGYGFSCDAHHITAPAEDGSGARHCMTEALSCARLTPEQITYINAHGTSTPINDPAETAAIKQVFGAYAKEGLLVSSTKSMTGHLLGAAGGLEAVICSLAIKNGVVPPTTNLDNPEEGCDLDYVANQAREVNVKAAMSNSFGFGGTNASIILQQIS